MSARARSGPKKDPRGDLYAPVECVVNPETDGAKLVHVEVCTCNLVGSNRGYVAGVALRFAGEHSGVMMVLHLDQAELLGRALLDVLAVAQERHDRVASA